MQELHDQEMYRHKGKYNDLKEDYDDLHKRFVAVNEKTATFER